MHRPTVLHVEDEARIEALRQRLGADTCLEVIRKGLDRLEKETAHLEPTAEAIATSTEQVLYDFHEEAPDAGGA